SLVGYHSTLTAQPRLTAAHHARSGGGRSAARGARLAWSCAPPRGAGVFPGVAGRLQHRTPTPARRLRCLRGVEYEQTCITRRVRERRPSCDPTVPCPMQATCWWWMTIPSLLSCLLPS